MTPRRSPRGRPGRPVAAATLAVALTVSCGGLGDPAGRHADPPAAEEQPAAAAAAATRAARAATPPAAERFALSPVPARPAPGAAGLSDRQLAYLARARRQLDRLEGAIHRTGPDRQAAAALVAAALSLRGAAPAAAVGQHLEGALEPCAGRWGTTSCERALLSLQRVALQFPAAVPERLREPLRRAAGAAVPPPAADRLEAPWSFPETENQRLVRVARALAAHAVAGTGDSDAGRAWARHAEALLAARDASGWYEADSAGYLALSIQALLHLRDLAPAAPVRRLADRELDLAFARWAVDQVGAVPAGARTRTYLHWALAAPANTPWRAWAWFAADLGDPAQITFRDAPEMGVTGYRFPDPVRRLLAHREELGSYEIRQRRRISSGGRRDVDAALYGWATPDYILSASQAVDGLALAVSGGQEIPVVLLPEGVGFAPLYLWSRVDDRRAERWRSRVGQEQAVADHGRALARLGTAAEPGHAYLAAAWSRPRPAGDAVVARAGGTYVALVTAGGWTLAPAGERFPAVYRGSPARGAWVAVPQRQPAAIGLLVGRAAEAGTFAAWTARAADLRLIVSRDPDGVPTRLGLAAGGEPLVFHPGGGATVGGDPVEARGYPLFSTPALAHGADGWHLRTGGADVRLAPLKALP